MACSLRSTRNRESVPGLSGAPQEVQERGFFEVLRYWLVRTEHMLHEDWIPYRVSLLGNYGTDLTLKREINRFLMAEDPYGTVAFVRFGVQRAELHQDLDLEMIVSILDWMMERFQDALLTEELDPGLFRRQVRLESEKKRASTSSSISSNGRLEPDEGQHLARHRYQGAMRMIRRTSVEEILASYNDRAPLSEASTIPAPWYVDPRIAELENLIVFSKTGKRSAAQTRWKKPGQFVTATLAANRSWRVRGTDGQLRAFYNVCRHHAAKVVTEPCGRASILHCPYHGWNYGLDGS